MALHIRDALVEQLVEDVTAITGESATEAIRRALDESKRRLDLPRDRARRVRAFLEREVWPFLPEPKARRRLNRAARDSMLGYGQKGV